MPRVLITMDEMEEMVVRGAVVAPGSWPPVGQWMFLDLHGGGRARVERVSDALLDVAYSTPLVEAAPPEDEAGG